jgi:hypothetical protein
VIRSDVSRWAEQVAEVYKMSKAYRIVIRKPEGKRCLGRPRPRQEDNVDM